MTIEVITNLFQGIMFTGFLYLFFDKPEGLLIKILPFFGVVTALFTNLTIFTFMGLGSKFAFLHLDSLLYIAVMELYALLFLRGKVYLRVIMPLIAFGLNAVVAYTFSYLVSFVTGIPYENSLVVSSTFRYLCLVAVNFTTALLLWLILRFGSERIRLTGAYEMTAFSIIPVLGTIILYCLFFIFNVTGFNEDILVYLLIISLSVVAIAALSWVLILHISRANKAKTDLLLTAQREKLYEKSILDSNEQIERISSIRHDMLNNMRTLELLISEGNTQQAKELCSETLRSLEGTHTPVHTDNPTLNAIINVEMEKAVAYDIEFTLDISDTLAGVSSSAIVSLIGNLCDNSIEYLRNKPTEIRRMTLCLRSHLNFHIISCKNRISESVLSKNPEFFTTKNDKSLHGKGMRILRRIAKEYGGNVRVEEEENYITISVVLGEKE